MNRGCPSGPSRSAARSTRRLAPIVLGLALLTAAEARAETLTLERAYALAARNNPSLRVLKERVEQAEVARQRAWAALKPTASFQATFTHYDQEVVVDFARMSPIPIPGAEPIVIQKQNQFAFTGIATLPLFRGPAYPRLGLARQGIELARLREIRTQQDFLLRVAQAYYQIVSRGETVSALEHKLAVDRKHLAAARAQFEVGQAARPAVLRADLVVTQDEQSLRAQKIALEAARRQLGILIGTGGTPEVARPPEPPDPAGSQESMRREALQLRVDVRAATLSQQIAERSRDAIWWSFAPSLDLSWMYRWTEAAGFAGQNGSWNLMLTLSVPLYDGGLRYAELRDARSRVREAEAQNAGLVLELEAEIVRLRAELESSLAAVRSARKAVELAKTTESDMETSYNEGAATQLDVLDAAQRYLDAQLQLTASLFNRDLSRLALAHALGRFDPLRRDGLDGRPPQRSESAGAPLRRQP
jgi:outer membrane protein TolC